MSECSWCWFSSSARGPYELCFTIYSWRTMYRYRLHAFIVYECFVWSICAIIAIRWDGREHENASPKKNISSECVKWLRFCFVFFSLAKHLSCPKMRSGMEWRQPKCNYTKFCYPLAGWSAVSHQWTIAHTAVLCYRKFMKHVHEVAAALHLVKKKKKKFEHQRNLVSFSQSRCVAPVIPDRSIEEKNVLRL